MGFPDNTDNLTATPDVVGDYHGEPIYAWYYATGNYWIAYILSVPGYVGAGPTMDAAAVSFNTNIDKVVGVEEYGKQLERNQLELFNDKLELAGNLVVGGGPGDFGGGGISLDGEI